MATATVETKTVTKTEEVEAKVYTLTLDEEEAKTLKALLSIVGGSQIKTYNKHTYEVYRALVNAGISGPSFASRFRIDYFYGTIYGKDIRN